MYPPNLQRARRLRPIGSFAPTYEDAYSRGLAAGREAQERSAKRRKLDQYSIPTSNRPTFKYGHYGQVEPGRLMLDLVSCDGDTHDERGPIYFGPENILKHDKSVYSSKSSKCNIVLRHHDGTAFCLEKLYIVAPDRGFTAP